MTENNEIDLRRFFRSARKLKWVYIASTIVFVGMAIAYACISRPKYVVRSSMIIEDSNNDAPQMGAGLTSMIRLFSIGGFGASSVDNELLLVNSYDLMLRTVKRLGLNVTYTRTNGLKKESLFNNSPIIALAPHEILDTLLSSINIEVRLHDGKADIEAYQGRVLKKTLTSADNVTLPYTLQTIYGPIQLLAGQTYSTIGNDEIKITLTGYNPAAQALYSEVSTDVSNKTSDGIDFELKDSNPERGKAFLNALMDEYNLKRIDRKHSTAAQELEFIESRLEKLSAELSESEHKVEDYKNKNNTVDITAEAPLIFENALDVKNDIVKMASEIQYYEQVLNAIGNSDSDQLLPMTSLNGVQQQGTLSMIADYNREVTSRQELKRSAKPGNPALEQASKRIDNLQAAIRENIGTLLLSSRNTYNNMVKSVGESTSHLRKMPRIERELTDLIRDKQIKNELYLYLLQKRESALLQLSSTGSPGFIIDRAYSSIKPSRSKIYAIFAIALILSLFVPTMITLLYMRRHNKVYEPSDMHFIGLEERTVALTDSKSSINRLRSLLTACDSPLKVYVADFAKTNPIRMIVDAYASIGKNAIEMPSTATDNDGLQTPKFQENLVMELQHHDYDAIFIGIANPERLDELGKLLNAPDTMLMIVAVSGQMGRKTIGAIIKATGVTADNIAILLLPE